MTHYEVYGYYSREDVGRPGEYLETFQTLDDAVKYAKDFERFFGRHAWIEEKNFRKHEKSC